MSTATEDILQVCEALRPAKRAEVADFARFLLAREGDEAWERILSNLTPRPKLEMFLRESATEGEQPLDPSRL